MKSLLKCDVQKVYKLNISRKTIKKLQNIAQFLCAQIFSTFFFQSRTDSCRRFHSGGSRWFGVSASFRRRLLIISGVSCKHPFRRFILESLNLSEFHINKFRVYFILVHSSYI